MKVDLPPMFINSGEEGKINALRIRYSGITGYTGWEVAYRREQQLLAALSELELLKGER